MTNTSKAAFTLKDYSVNNFSFKNLYAQSDELELNFEPKGIFNSNSGEYILVLNFEASENNEVLFKTEIQGNFQIVDVQTKESIPEFFYNNAIAILFPYLRAYLSSITLQANVRLLILPTLNLSALAPILKENTKVN